MGQLQTLLSQDIIDRIVTAITEADEAEASRISTARRETEAAETAQALARAQDEIDQLKRAFDTVDREETGTIPAFGLEPVLRALGMDPIEEDIEALLAELGIDMNGNIQFVEFAGVLARLKV